MNTIVKKAFGGSSVAFEPSILNENVMVNATQMAKIFGKDVPDFLILKQTKEFISECLNNQNSGFLGVKKETDLVRSRQKSGTWMHRILALKFAAWLDPAFELWVYTQIDEILFGYAHEHDANIKRTILLQQELHELEKKPDKSGEDLEQYIKLQNMIVSERSNRAAATKSRFREIYRSLKPRSYAN